VTTRTSASIRRRLQASRNLGESVGLIAIFERAIE
jgi:hypothetical protein